jgi:hypothetical protein
MDQVTRRTAVRTAPGSAEKGFAEVHSARAAAWRVQAVVRIRIAPHLASVDARIFLLRGDGYPWPVAAQRGGLTGQRPAFATYRSPLFPEAERGDPQNQRSWVRESLRFETYINLARLCLPHPEAALLLSKRGDFSRLSEISGFPAVTFHMDADKLRRCSNTSGWGSRAMWLP